MNLSGIAKQVGEKIVSNSPVLLTAIGVSGVVTTALLTARASFRAVETLGMYDDRIDMTPREMTELVWTEFIPPVAAGAVTVAAIIAANRVGSRRTAAVVAAYEIVERTHREYEDKVREHMGEAKERKVREELAQDRIDQVVGNREILIVGDKSLFLDDYSGRTFEATYQEVLAAQNWINYELNNQSLPTLSDFYDRIGLPHLGHSDRIGWDSSKQLELEIEAGKTANMQPCLVVTFKPLPGPVSCF